MLGLLLRMPMTTLVDSLIAPQCVFRPGSFTGLMTLYESNYVRLLSLIPDVDCLAGPRASLVVDDFDLHVELIKRERYTSTLRLTYWFPEEQGWIADPDLVVRVYHDAKLVEAMESCTEHRHRLLREIARASVELDLRWARNMMLNKWLDYLLDMGHSLPTQQMAASETQ
jgi:uncharacterized protein YqiB (DUF1249 family)